MTLSLPVVFLTSTGHSAITETVSGQDDHEILTTASKLMDEYGLSDFQVQWEPQDNEHRDPAVQANKHSPSF